MPLVYVIQRLFDGKSYVGQTVKESVRKRYGSLENPSLDRCNRPIDRAFRKYGGKAFQFVELMKDVPLNEVDFWERFWINCFDSCNREIGYNLESGGNKKKKLAPETRKKMAEAQRGRKFSPERRAKMQPIWDKLKGVSHPWPEQRKQNYTRDKHPLYKVRTWWHPAHGEFVGSIVDLITAFPEQKLSRGNLSCVAQGKPSCYVHKGWRVPRVDGSAVEQLSFGINLTLN